jgi:hypothetical protein
MVDHSKPFDARSARVSAPVRATVGRFCGIVGLAFALLSFADSPSATRAEEPPLDRPEAAGPPPGQRVAPVEPSRLPLGAIEAWLSTEFDLPLSGEPPRIELIPPAKLILLRYHGLLPEGAMARAQASLMRDTVAIYVDSRRTIYLAEGWTGLSHADLSVLVHEMVHHMQNLAGLKYKCPQEREKLAYAAQDRWLGLVGHSLEQDFELDGFSLMFKTRCLY